MPALSKQQQKLFGLALAAKRGDIPKSKVSDEIKDIVKRMSEKDIEDFASTKHKGLPNKLEMAMEQLINKIDESKMDVKKLNKKFLGKRISFKDKKGKKWVGKADYIGVNPTHGKLQITVGRTPIWPVDVKSIKLVSSPSGKFRTFSRNENTDLTFAQYQETQSKLNKITHELGSLLNSFPKDSMGMVKPTPEFKKIKKEFDTVFRELQNLNKKYVKLYKKEIQAARLEKRRKLQK